MNDCRERRAGPENFLVGAVHLSVMCGLAVAQPLFDVLARNPQALVFRGAQPADILFLILSVSLGLPAVAVLAEGAVGLLAPRAGRGVHAVFVVALGAAVALQVLKRLVGFPGTVLVAAAVIAGIVIAAVYARFAFARTFFTVLSPSVLVFPVVFLVQFPVAKVAAPAEGAAMAAASARSPATVVLVVFDGLPLTSLVDGRARIDEVRYPNFAALARDAVWFRNATTVSERTAWAVPAILTGSYPDPSRLPVAADHPRNLFTLLGPSYELRVSEPITRLCPAAECVRRSESVQGALTARWVSLLADLSVIYLHVLLPPDLTHRLPSLAGRWRDFGHSKWLKKWTDQSRRDRAVQVLEFIDAISPRPDRTALYFLHALLPHEPFVYLPSGKIYTTKGTPVGWQPGETWTADSLAAIHAYQRHLLQVGYVDTLMGRLLGRLKAVGLYESSLIVVVADHGASFRPGDSARIPTQTNFPDIITVPLFVKLPGQRVGRIDDRNVQTIDILPTIADVLGIDLPWHVDGRSALVAGAPGRPTKAVFLHEAEARMTFDAAAVRRAFRVAVRRKVALFGAGSPPDRLFMIGPHAGLIGQRIEDLGVTGEPGVKLDVSPSVLLNEVNEGGDFVPAHIRGAVCGGDGPVELAIGINGVIRATTRAYAPRAWTRAREWSVVVPEASLAPGQNEVEVLVVRRLPGEAVSLVSVYKNRMARPATYVNLGLGAQEIPGVKESGFYEEEDWLGKRVRWTAGTARVVVPIEGGRPPQALRVDLAGSGPTGTALRVSVNGDVLFARRIGAGTWSRTFSLAGLPLKNQARIELLSDTFVPTDMRADSGDERTLGVAVESIELLREDVPVRPAGRLSCG